MCNICYAEKNNILEISASPSTLCANHHQEWALEKSVGEAYYDEQYNENYELQQEARNNNE